MIELALTFILFFIVATICSAGFIAFLYVIGMLDDFLDDEQDAP